ncbi:MAG: outer membrane protein transport protein [Legionella sp.]|uniref:OmpP1/FadL family transporter n=1 Tax=Legionella sp. TaxID=459 RepID=UPI0039E306EA
MKNMHKPLRTLVSIAVIGVLATGVAHAAGFALYGEGSGYTAGNYAAGAAAEAADASTGWYNPAGLALIRNKQGVFGGTGIFPNMRINGSSEYVTEGLPPYEQEYHRVNGSYSGFVPASHFALPVGERTTLGLSFTGPYGLSTDWSPVSPVRYSATYTELITATISPEIGTLVLDNLAFGAGMDFQYSRVKFNQIIGAPTLLAALDENPAGLDTFSNNKGASWGLGFHVGLMALFNDNHTRLGVNYQSQVRHVFYGHSELKGILANNFDLLLPPYPEAGGVWKNNNLFSNPIYFPDVLTISGYQDINDQWAILGSAVYAGWHSFKTIQLNNVAAPNISSVPPFPVTEANVISTVEQRYNDAWRFALGANYHVTPQWMMRVGGGYDQSPTRNRYRDIRLPDVDRWAIAVGTHYQWKPTIGFDVGYTHLFSGSRPSVHSVQHFSTTSAFFVNSNNGIFAADLVGGQVVWTIDPVLPAPMK